jgi:hypothetical protein
VNGFDVFGRLCVTVPDRERQDRTEETERWAGHFAQLLPQALNDRFGVAPESSESWRGGVGSLTHAEPLAPLAAAPAAPSSSDDSLVFSLRAGDLGEIRFQLERSDAGVRVVIGADGRNAMTAAGAEQSALESALKAAGLRVQSVSVVPLSKFGTPLARGGGAPDARHVRHAHAGARSERTRRVKLIG